MSPKIRPVGPRRPAPTVMETLVEMIGLGLELLVTVSDREQIPRCRLSLGADDPTHLFLIVPERFTLSSKAPIVCLFTMFDKPFLFQSEILDTDKPRGPGRYYRIALPARIDEHNRRIYLRAKPSANEPVWLRCRNDRHGPIRLLVGDISGGGVSLFMPQTMRLSLKENNCQTLVIDQQAGIIPKLMQSAPECILLDTDDAVKVTTVCRLLLLNKQLNLSPKILLTKNIEVGSRLIDLDLITGFLEKPCPPKTLMTAIYQSIAPQAYQRTVEDAANVRTPDWAKRRRS